MYANYRRPYFVGWQWSCRKTGTVGTLASQAEFTVSVQAPGTLLLGTAGISPRKKFSDCI